jgi:hypothetical protein
MFIVGVLLGRSWRDRSPNGGADVVLQGDVRTLAADPGGEPTVPGPEIRTLRASGPERGKPEDGGEPPIVRTRLT